MASVTDELPGVRFGLTEFNAIDTSSRPQLEDGEDLAGDYAHVSLQLGDDVRSEVGHLYISSRRLIWLKSGEPPKGYFATFPSITMHAISQEPHPCIYAQLESSPSDSIVDEEEPYPEIRLTPTDSSELQNIFETLCQCAALNPDPVDEEDSDGGDFYYNEDEVLNGVGAENRAALLDRYDAMLEGSEEHEHELEELTGEDPDRFADPEAEEDLPDALQPST